MLRLGVYGLLFAFGWGASAQPSSRLPNTVWAPSGKRFAYIDNRTVWLYDVASASRKELVSLLRVERQAVQPHDSDGVPNRRSPEQSIQWSSNGAQLLISVGGDLFLYHLDTSKLEQVTATPVDELDAQFSPDGTHVAFRRNHDLYAVELASGTVTRLTSDGSATLWNGETDWVYPQELGLSTAYWWAPDSYHIAYLQFDVSRESVFPMVSMLDPKARLESQLYPQAGTPNAEVNLGIVSLGGNRRWMDLGRPRDRLIAGVHWSPDGRSVAVERFNRIQNRLDLLKVDIETGEPSLLLREQDPYWINANNDFHFLGKSGQFLWGSERDGFHHLYVYSADGQQAAQITRGDWEVTAISGVDQAARQVFYISNQSSPVERQLYRVDFDGAHAQRLTPGKGTHVVSMSPTCDYYLDTYSTLSQPPGTTLRARTGEQVAAYIPPATPPAQLLPAELRNFRTTDGDTLYARLIKPAGFVEGRKYPVIVIVYGGPHQQMVRDCWRLNSLEQALAREGFVIWQMDNRGSAGRGHPWETRIFHNLGAQELKDQQEGLDYLVSLGFSDPARVGIHGWSYGGYLTLYALTNSATFRAGVAAAPVTDWRNYISIYTERYMGMPEANPEGYRASSPLTHAANLKGGLLLVHNYEDENVHFQNSLQMAAALEQSGKQFDMLVYPQRSHGVTGTLRPQLDAAIVEFFQRKLK